MTASKSRLVALAFVAETLFAGANGVAIRFSNRELAPIWGAGLRFALAGILIVGVMLVLRLALPRGRSLLGAMLFGPLQFAGAFGFAYLALVRIHAGVGQTLLALVPLATLLLAVAQRQERLSCAALAGTLLGLAGIGLIFLDPGREAIPLGCRISSPCFRRSEVDRFARLVRYGDDSFSHHSSLRLARSRASNPRSVAGWTASHGGRLRWRAADGAYISPIAHWHSGSGQRPMKRLGAWVIEQLAGDVNLTKLRSEVASRALVHEDEH